MDWQRCAYPPEGSSQVERIEFEFDIAVQIDAEDYNALQDIFRRIVSKPFNQLRDGVHWYSGGGSKPKWSRRDAEVLGLEVDSDAPEEGEPSFDDSVLVFQSSARPYLDDKERQRKEKRKDSLTVREFVSSLSEEASKFLRGLLHEEARGSGDEMWKHALEKGGFIRCSNFYSMPTWYLTSKGDRVARYLEAVRDLALGDDSV